MSGGGRKPVKENVKPAGLVAIHKACSVIYSNQPNPRQATALVKYWLGGPDPLDYIFMYYHPATPEVGGAQGQAAKRASPPHWHYVSCGLSDLHGDGRVHERASDPSSSSGFGFELTFRLCMETSSSAPPADGPPTWPAELLQGLARYVFSSGNVLCAGDHVSWHAPLAPQQDSLIQHMLLAPDPQLGGFQSPLGSVQFVQVVGATAEELNAAQTWNATGLLALMRTNSVCGGDLLVTSIHRGECILDLLPEAWGVVEEGVRTQGSVLSAVSTLCAWEDDRGRPGSTLPAGTSVELMSPTVLDRAHLIFNLEAMQLWPLAIRGRLAHGNHFTFKGTSGDMAITLVTTGVEGALASDSTPLVAHGTWLQVYLKKEVWEHLLKDLQQLLQPSPEEQAEGGLRFGLLRGGLACPPPLPAQLKIQEVGVVISVVATPTPHNGLTSAL